MKTNNRPMVKVVEYEYKNVYGDKEWYKQGLFPFAETTKPTTRVREVERPMNDTEYIEYLETKINYNQNCNCFLACNDKDVCLYQQLLKENQELKDKNVFMNKTIVVREKEIHNLWNDLNEQRDKTYELKVELSAQQDKFLKVVESVLNETTFGDNIISKISGDTLSKEVIKTLLQEIKSEMLKGSE